MSVVADDLHIAALRNESLTFRIKEFVRSKGLRILDETIVKAIKNEALAKKMPRRYIDGIWSDVELEGGSISLTIGIDFKGKKLEPLDLFFEEGTKDHKITPIRKKALAFLEKGAIGIVTGIRRFSKGHWVSGIEARHIFKNGIKTGYPEFKRKLAEDIELELKETRLFGSQN